RHRGAKHIHVYGCSQADRAEPSPWARCAEATSRAPCAGDIFPRYRATRVREPTCTGGGRMTRKPVEPLSDAAARDRLAAELQGWTLSDGWVQRSYQTDGWSHTLMVANHIAFL